MTSSDATLSPIGWNPMYDSPVPPPPPRKRDEAQEAYLRWMERQLWRAARPGAKPGSVRSWEGDETLQGAASTYYFLAESAGGEGTENRAAMFYRAVPRSPLGSAARVTRLPDRPTLGAVVNLLFDIHFCSLHTSLDVLGTKLHALRNAGVIDDPAELARAVAKPAHATPELRRRAIAAAREALGDSGAWAGHWVEAVLAPTGSSTFDGDAPAEYALAEGSAM